MIHILSPTHVCNSTSTLSPWVEACGSTRVHINQPILVFHSEGEEVVLGYPPPSSPSPTKVHVPTPSPSPNQNSCMKPCTRPLTMNSLWPSPRASRFTISGAYVRTIMKRIIYCNTSLLQCVKSLYKQNMPSPNSTNKLLLVVFVAVVILVH